MNGMQARLPGMVPAVILETHAGTRWRALFGSKSPSCEMVEEIGAYNDRKECNEAFGLSGPIGFAC
tara:strand:+ start:86 stop:283 length:198 start_codon:yes stop_codon:yes gene_type:complete